MARLRAQNPLNVVIRAGDFIGASRLTSALFFDEPSVDAAGRLAGLAMKGDGSAAVLPVAVLRENLGDVLGAATPTSPPAATAPRMAADEVDERGLRVALQVIVAR